MSFGLLGWVLLIVILALGGVLGAYGVSREFRAIMVGWGIGLIAIALSLAVGVVLMLWSPWIGLAFYFVAALYILDRMLKS